MQQVLDEHESTRLSVRHVALFGGTNGIGRAVLDQALDAGLAVTALARDASKLAPRDGLRVVQGSATDPDAVAATLAGVDAVVCALGAPALSRSKVRSEGLRAITDAMAELGIRRVAVVGIMGAGASRAKLPFFLRRVLFPTYLRRPVQEHERQEAILRESDLDWTVVRPPNLTDGPRTGDYAHGEVEDWSTLSIAISRADVADLILGALRGGHYVRQTPIISYRAA
ncbi:MAG: SDR family oxidoreductase [Sandaracinaceae bacterium]